MQDFINGFLKAWKAWSDDGKDAFLESFLDEVKNSKTDPSNFLGILEQEIKSLSQEGLKDDISSMLEVIESIKNEISHTKDNENVSDFFNAFQQEINEEQSISNDNPSEFVESLEKVIVETQNAKNPNELELLRPTGENTTSKIASLALEENNQLNEKETNTQEQAKHTEKEQEKPKIAPNNDIDLKDKYANLHSFFKQTELDIKQKRIKTKLDFKESFLNYAKNHMNEDELKVLLVVSQKEPTKLTKEHINLIKDCLEQAHGNKHMQDKGLQLSVKSILGHELEKEHHEVLKDYLAKSKDSLEPMDNRVYEVIQKHLDKQQEKALKNLDSATQSVGVNANKNSEQPKNSQNEPRQETTNAQTNRTATQQEIQEKAQSNNSDEPWIEFGKKEQARAKAHYQAMLEKEKAKELAKEQNNAQKEVKKEMPTIDYGYTQNTLSKSRRR